MAEGVVGAAALLHKFFGLFPHGNAVGGDGTASITLHLMMQFGARIPSVAEKVQENVKSAVQNMTNVTVSRVDLVIAGLTEAQ